jgi:hypothetical protein
MGVWGGFDDERPLKLSGARAALPIWCELAVRLIPGDLPDFEVPTKQRNVARSKRQRLLFPLGGRNRYGGIWA